MFRRNVELAQHALSPFIIGAFSVLSRWAANINDVPAKQLVRPLTLSLVVAALVFGVILLLRRDINQAAISGSIVKVQLLSDGRIYDGLKTVGLSGTSLVRHRFLLPVFLFSLAVFALVVFRLRPSDHISHPVTTFGLVGIAFPILIAVRCALERRIGRSSPIAGSQPCALSKPESGPMRDIYLIIMDAHERDDVLLQMHGFNNRYFQSQLENLGFYVARGSMSNYRSAVLSLVSMLNMDYIQAFSDRYNQDSRNWWPIAHMIADNRVRRELKCIGYNIVALESGVNWTQWPDADHYLSLGQNPVRSLGSVGPATRFEAFCLDTIIARAVLDWIREFGSGGLPSDLDPSSLHRQRMSFEFDQSQEIAVLPSPKFVYAHLVSPPPPMVFGQGNDARGASGFESAFAAEPTQSELLSAYTKQVAYLNERLIGALTAIIEQSAEVPIILITGDHGWAD